MRGDKFLIVDTSGFEPIRYSISEGFMTMNDLNSFLSQANIQLCITNSILQKGEFSYSETPDLLTFRYNQFSSADTASSSTSDLPIKTCWLTSNGTMTTYEEWGDLEFKVFNISVQTAQTNLQKPSNYLSKLSPQDISNISLAHELSISGNNAAIFANDWNLKQQAIHDQFPVYGTCSFLAGAVLSGIYTHQKATKLYYKWKMVDPRWVPRDLLFKDVLSIERKRNKDKESFWFNYD